MRNRLYKNHLVNNMHNQSQIIFYYCAALCNQLGNGGYAKLFGRNEEKLNSLSLKCSSVCAAYAHCIEVGCLRGIELCTTCKKICGECADQIRSLGKSELVRYVRACEKCVHECERIMVNYNKVNSLVED